MIEIDASTIVDTAADVSAEIDALNADPNLTSITLTDPGTPVLTLSFEQAADDTSALSVITGPYTIAISDTIGAYLNYAYVVSQTNVSSITIVDSAEDIAGNLGTLLHNGVSKLAGIVTTDGKDWAAIGSVSVADYLANQTALDAAGDVRIADTAANIAANFDALNSDSNISWIAVTDGGALTLDGPGVAFVQSDAGRQQQFQRIQSEQRLPTRDGPKPKLSGARTKLQ
jgi:hypothetical protein